MKKFLDNVVFSVRWVLYPVNIGLVTVLLYYVGHFLMDDYNFIFNTKENDMESLMVLLLGFVDAAMVAQLVIMIVQGGHQIFIRKFYSRGDEGPQYLDHIDTGILKVKVAMSITSITLIQLLKDFVNLEKVPWELVQHKMMIHALTLASAVSLAVIWRILKHDTKHDAIKSNHEVHPSH